MVFRVATWLADVVEKERNIHDMIGCFAVGDCMSDMVVNRKLMELIVLVKSNTRLKFRDNCRHHIAVFKQDIENTLAGQHLAQF